MEACVYVLFKATRYVRDICIWHSQALDRQQHAWKRLYMHADQSQRALPIKSMRIHCKKMWFWCAQEGSAVRTSHSDRMRALLCKGTSFHCKNVVLVCTALHMHQNAWKRVYMRCRGGSAAGTSHSDRTRALLCKGTRMLRNVCIWRA